MSIESQTSTVVSLPVALAPAVDYSELFAAGRTLLGSVTCLQEFCDLQISLWYTSEISDYRDKMKLSSHYSDAIVKIQPLAWSAATMMERANNIVGFTKPDCRDLTPAQVRAKRWDEVHKLDDHLNAIEKSAPSIIHFLQTATLPRVRKVLYARHNPLPHVLHALHLGKVSRRLQLWCQFPCLINDVTKALHDLPAAMQVVRNFMNQDLYGSAQPSNSIEEDLWNFVAGFWGPIQLAVLGVDFVEDETRF